MRLLPFACGPIIMFIRRTSMLAFFITRKLVTVNFSCMIYFGLMGCWARMRCNDAPNAHVGVRVEPKVRHLLKN